MIFLGVCLAVAFLILLIMGIVYLDDYEKTKGVICIIVAFLVLVISIVCFKVGSQSNSFKRGLRDIQSNYSQGITRTISITAEDGREIYYYHGTIDIELNGEERKIKFEDENGKRQIIIYGVQDTVTIIED